MRSLLVFAGIVLAIAGYCQAECRCASAAWVQAHGGLADTAPQQAADRAAAPLRLSDVGVGTFRVLVLDEAYPAAYAWPSGDVYLTRGLVESRTAEQLTAALAHELGHLVNDGHLGCPRALVGDTANEHASLEERADATGARLLRASGFDAGAMKSLLEAMAADTRLDRSLRDRFKARAALLKP